MKRAVIVGAGIAGLATALRLHQDGWQVLVAERAPARRSSGYMVNLIGSGYDAAERLGLLPALTAADLGLFTTVLVHADGRPKFTVPSAIAEAALGKRALSVFRGDLEASLFEAVQHRVDIRFGTTATSVEQDTDHVRVELSDGTIEQADLLVGADGALGHPNRRVRPRLPGGPPVPRGCLPAASPGARRARVVRHHVHRSRAHRGDGQPGPGAVVGVLHLSQRGPAADLGRGPVDALRAAFGDLWVVYPTRSTILRRTPPAPTSTRSARWSCRAGAPAASCCSETRRGA